MNLNKILSDSQYYSTRWTHLISTLKESEKFITLLLPAIEYVALSLENKVTLKQPVFAKDLLTFLIKDNLIPTLMPMIGRVCVLEMHIARTSQLLKGNTSRERFQSFIETLHDPKVKSAFFEKYPLLKQKIEIVLQHCLETTIHFFSRFNEDKKEIYQTFLNNDSSYVLQKVISSGDKHNHGQSVMMITFSNSQGSKKIVYKPRSLAIDVAFQRLIIWINQFLTATQLQTLTILEKNHYGWCNHIDQEKCKDLTDIDHYYQRMGYLLMLTYFLNGSDLHYENIIACGSQPIIVDYECFLRPFFLVNNKNHLNDFTPPLRFVSDTCFLPQRVMSREDHHGIDVSALTGKGGDEAPYTAMEWSKEGTDEMVLIRTKQTMSNQKNRPQHSSEIDPTNYLDAFLKGFTDLYHILLDNMNELKKAHSPLLYFKGVETRVLLRNTGEYGKLLIESYHPFLLQSTEKRAAHFAWLEKQNSPALLSELADLEENNIPAFYGLTDQYVIKDSNGQDLSIQLLDYSRGMNPHGQTKGETALTYPSPPKLPSLGSPRQEENKFQMLLSGWDYLQSYMNLYINEEDLFLQTQLIKYSFVAHRLNTNSEKSIIDSTFFIPNTSIDPKQLAKQQLDILLKTKIINGKKIYWSLVEKRHQTWHSTFTDIYLYQGIAGIALAFAYGGSILKEDIYTDCAQQCIENLMVYARHADSSSFNDLGAFSGLSSIIYTFTTLATLWKDENLLTQANKLCHLIPSLIKKDHTFDIIAGVTGCLAVLIHRQDQLDSTTVTPLLHHCVNHFLTHFPALHNETLLGFSHGVAGMAWALAKYDKQYPSEKVKQWIRSALDYERKQYSPHAHNWPDLRHHKRNFDSNAWCHGAPGIGLARMDMQSTWNDSQFLEEIAVAIDNIKITPYYHGLCHGNLGNIELLLQSPHSEKYIDHIYQVVKAIQKEGAYCERTPPETTPGLMSGIAGIAYQLLRIAEPDHVPAILLLK